MDDKKPTCSAVLTIAGEFFGCDWPIDESGHHDGWGHTNKEVQATWMGDDTEVTTNSMRFAGEQP